MTQKRAGITEKKRPQRIVNPSGGRLLTLKAAADYLGFTVWGMREAVWAGLIPVVRVPGGRKFWLDRLDLDSFIARHKTVIS